MRPTTTTALALAGTAMALPAVAMAESDDPPSPTDIRLAAPFAGHLSIGSQMQAERRVALQQRLTPRAVRLAGRTARVTGVEFSRRAERRRLRGESPDALRSEIRENRRELRRAERAQQAVRPTAPGASSSAASPQLEAIAACESGGDPSANTGNGFYGKYQFTQSTWESVGGTGNPAAASEAEQDQRAAMLYEQAGAGQWPVCGG